MSFAISFVLELKGLRWFIVVSFLYYYYRSILANGGMHGKKSTGAGSNGTAKATPLYLIIYTYVLVNLTTSERSFQLYSPHNLALFYFELCHLLVILRQFLCCVGGSVANFWKEVELLDFIILCTVRYKLSRANVRKSLYRGHQTTTTGAPVNKPITLLYKAASCKRRPPSHSKCPRSPPPDIGTI